MSTIRVPSVGTVEERLLRLEQANNYEEEVLCSGIIDEQTGASVTGGAVQIVGGWTIPWGELHELLPHERWLLWATGWADCTGATGCVFQLGYQKNDFTSVVLGQRTIAAPFTWAKVLVGPFPARGPFATSIPEKEVIDSYNLGVSVGGAGVVTLRRWTMWMRMSPRST